MIESRDLMMAGGAIILAAAALVFRVELARLMRGRWRLLADALCVAAISLVLLNAPFHFRSSSGVYSKCRDSVVYAPPTRPISGSTELLCSINMQQLGIRLMLVIAAWAAIRIRLPK